MENITITISDAEEKALLTDMASIQEWASNFVHSTARRLMDTIVESTTDRRASAVPEAEKESIVISAKI